MTKRDDIIGRLAELPEPQLVPIEEFLDGNDDLGSIGCNLDPHPGLDEFRSVLHAVVRRPDVTTVLARIVELDPGPGSWPFTDTVFVIGRISAEDVAAAVSSLQPDEVGAVPAGEIPDELPRAPHDQVFAVWWD